MKLTLYSVDGKKENLTVGAVTIGFTGVAYYVGDPLTNGHSEFVHYSTDNKHGLDYAVVTED